MPLKFRTHSYPVSETLLEIWSEIATQIVSETIQQLGSFKPIEYRIIKVFRSPLNMLCVKQYVVLLEVEDGSTLAYDVIFLIFARFASPNSRANC